MIPESGRQFKAAGAAAAEFCDIIRCTKDNKEKVKPTMPAPRITRGSVCRPAVFRLALALLLLLAHGAGFSLPPSAAADPQMVLAQKYREWLDLVSYIITPLELKAFRQLTNDRDRDAFISIFWSQRDPTRGTPENEFKDEHIKRWEYANRYYGYTSPRPGWKTDRGRIHILLGPPASRNEIFKSHLYPLEIWEYYGDQKKGLPLMFRVVFYRKDGAGDFKLYIPAQDGPDKLMVRYIGQVSSYDYAEIYKQIQEISPEVAEIAFSLIPGERTINFSPSMRDLQLIAKIGTLPLENLNTTYASQFLNYRAYVTVEDSLDFVNSRHQLAVLPEPLLGMNFVHFAVWPERVSVDYSEDKNQYYCGYKLVVDLKQKGRSIFQYTKNLPYSCPRDQLDTTLGNGLIVADMVPVIDGEYELTVFLQNAVNKEFTFFDEKVRTGPPPAGRWAFYGPLATHRLVREPRAGRSAFQLLDLQAMPDPQLTFGQQEAPHVLFAVDRGAYRGRLQGEVEVSRVTSPGAEPFLRTIAAEAVGESALQVFRADLQPLPPGYYRLQARARDDNGTVRGDGEVSITVSMQPRLPHPPVAAPLLSSGKDYVFRGMLASQYENSGRPAEAQRAYEAALAQNAADPALRIAYARFLFAQKKYDPLLALVAPLQGHEPSAFDYFALRGRTLYQLGRFTEAVADLLEANRRYDSDVSVLNTLGLSFVKLNNLPEARRALNASLRVNPQQPEIAALLKRLEAP